ncbi:MAG: ABC transporter permease, partial [Alphaproteobacteria bacterium]
EKIPIRGEHPTIERLLGKVRKASPAAPPDPIRPPGFIALLNRAGYGAVQAWSEFLGLLSFIGETAATMARLVRHPSRIRWKSVVAIMEDAGLDALPIVCFLSFFIGLVIAFIGANLLAMFNASVFTVELVGIGMLREFGAVLTAILLAGRTDSAFTAQIGAMKMTQEIDAMRTIGLDPMEALVAPRLIALVIMTPLLTFAATISGIAGGLVAAWTAMDISPQMFISRFNEVVPPQHFWVGIVKAPVFALVVAMVGCRQGMLVEGDVVSLGRRTTSAVVQAIFLVIALDAAFAVLYYMLNV